MQKKKLLIWCDFVAPTGFANVAKNLFDDLHKYYDVSILGINYHGDRKYDTNKYFVYSVTRDDMIGLRRLPQIIERDKPDIILLFQDIFYISDIIAEVKAKKKPDAKVVVYFPVDGAPFSTAWSNVFKEADGILTYSDWAIKVIKDRVKDIKKPIYKLYHGVNTDVFKQLPDPEIKEIRKSLNWENKFVIVNINRFQPRKAIPLSARAFSMFAKGYKKCKCGNHMPLDRTSCDLNMCPPEDILETVEHNRKDVYMYFHMMPQEPSMGPGRANLLQNHLINAGFNDIDAKTILGINGSNIYNHEVPEEQINRIYNGANINISSTLGEGCGLSLLEAAATGTPSIAPKNSAVPEMLNGTGHLIKNLGLMNQAMDNGHLRPIVDPWEMALALEYEYQNWKNMGKGKIPNQACVDNIKKNFLWDDKRELLRKVLSEV